ncbi:MAG: hypothetical protein JXR34_07410 [Bacteroidales bacterium]|nr:hypothetical protein [Bacteroidales bacterium]
MKQTEGQILGRYIIGENISETALNRYAEGIEKLRLTKDSIILEKVQHNPFLLPAVDAGLTLINRHHPLLRRLMLMFAILETIPEYASHFLAKKRNFFYLIRIGFYGIRGVFWAVIGWLYLKSTFDKNEINKR